MPFSPSSSLRAAAVAAALILALSACAPATDPAADPSTPAAAALPGTHIHGLSVNADTGQVLLATHDGLFDVTNQPATKIGATIDWMGFTPGHDEGVFYASGHPGAGSDLPNPLGLMKSRDGGKTWEQLSQQGQSDFHALTTTKSGIVAFDGTLRTSPDGTTWTTVAAGFAPAVLTGHPHSDTVLATTPKGIQRSTDAGKTWALMTSGPVIQFAAFANPTEAAGVEPDGTVHTSADGGSTWTKKGRIEGEVQAIAATTNTDGKSGIWAATSAGIFLSADGGTTFQPFEHA